MPEQVLPAAAAMEPPRVVDGMAESMKTLGVYIVLCFFAAQFVAYFKWTNLGLIFAIKGAGALEAAGLGDIPRTNDGSGEPKPSEQGYLHCGPAGAGHFVKMVHNGIEYALMAAYAEGFNLLKHAGIGKHSHDVDAETSPLSNPEHYQYDIDVAEVAELWRRGSVVASWLLDLTAASLQEDAELSNFSGRVSDSGEGRWTSIAAIDVGAPAPLLTTSLYSRFSSRGEADYADKLLSAMRYQFGGHHEKSES